MNEDKICETCDHYEKDGCHLNPCSLVWKFTGEGFEWVESWHWVMPYTTACGHWEERGNGKTSGQ